jgi:hypothetical protein
MAGVMIGGLSHNERKENAMEPTILDAAGHRRSPVTMPGYHRGRPPATRADATQPTRRPLTRSSP